MSKIKPMIVATASAGNATLTANFPNEGLVPDVVEAIRKSVRQLASLTEDAFRSMGVALRKRGYQPRRDDPANNVVSAVFSELLRRNQVQHSEVRTAVGVAGVRSRVLVYLNSAILAEVNGTNAPVVFSVARNFKNQSDYMPDVIAAPVIETQSETPVEQPEPVVEATS